MIPYGTLLNVLLVILGGTIGIFTKKIIEIDLDNPYYHDLHANWIDKYHGEEITVDMIGGRECAKCHY